jgi:Glycosyltransferase family 87
VIALALALIGSAAMLNYYLNWFLPRAREVRAARQLVGYSFGNDLYTVWYGAHAEMQGQRDLYSPEMAHEIQMGLYGRSIDPSRPGDPKDLRIFGYPAFTALLFWPFSWLSFEISRLVFFFIQIPMIVATTVLWMRALSWRSDCIWTAALCLLVLTSYPALEAVYSGQVGVFVCFVLAASIAAMQRGRLLLAGALMALGTIKPHVMLLPILYVGLWTVYDWRNRRMFCVGLFSTEALLVGTALIVWPHWIQSWINVVLRYHGYTPPSLTIQMLTTLAGPAARPAAVLAMAGLLLVSIALSWKNRAASPHSPEFQFTLAILLSITVGVLLPGHAVYDHLILLPGIFLLARSWRSLPKNWAMKAMLMTAGGTVLWPWWASLLLIPIHSLLARRQFYSMSILGLPLRMAAGLPFIVLALLALAYRSNSRMAEGKLSPKSSFDHAL